MPIVLRVEDGEGRGFYHSPRRPDCVNEMYDYDRNPNFWDDDLLRRSHKKVWKQAIPDGYHFGFLNLQQYTNWIEDPNWRIELHKVGFSLSVYSTKQFALGDCQILFKRKRATKIAEIDMRTNKLKSL